jgi:hypothetical protein
MAMMAMMLTAGVVNAQFGSDTAKAKPSEKPKGGSEDADTTAAPSEGFGSPAKGAKPAASESKDKDKEPGNEGFSSKADAASDLAAAKPLITDAEWKKWTGKARSEFRDHVQRGDQDAASKQSISTGIRMQTYALTLPSLRDVSYDIVAQLRRSVGTAADSKDTGSQRVFRKGMLDDIIKRCRELGDNQLFVRLDAAIILGNAFVVEENNANRVAAEFYTPAFDALLEVLEKPGQPDAIKVAAVRGLANAAIYGNPPLLPSQNIRLATRLIAELEKPNTAEPYQEALCETLASIDQVVDLDGQPFIVHALGKVMFDKGRSLCARAAAAKALGRAQMSPSIDLKVLVYGIADLSRQIVEAKNDAKKHIRRWCVINVFLAFKPKNSAEKMRHFGLLERVEEPAYQKYRKMVNEAYNAVKPMIVDAFGQPDAAFSQAARASILNWLKQNPAPSNLRISPNLPPLGTQQVSKAESNPERGQSESP